MKNFTSPFENNKILTNKQKYSTILMKNCGLDPIIFNNMQKYVYAYQKNNMKKVSSLNAIIAIPINEEEIIKTGIGFIPLKRVKIQLPISKRFRK